MRIRRTGDPNVSFAEADPIALWALGIVEWKIDTRWRWMELVSLHRAVRMSAAALAVKLRLTARSTHDRYAPRAVSTATGVMPWEDDALGEDDRPAA